MSQAPDRLGKVRQEFRPNTANIAAGMILGTGLIVGGIAFAITLAQKAKPDPEDPGAPIAKYVAVGALGVVAPIGGIALLVWMKRLTSHRVTIHDNGFSYIYRGSTESCPWTEVEKIAEVFTEEQMKVLKVPGAAIKNIDRSFVVHRNDGKEFHFSVNSIDGLPRFAECLEAARDQHSIPWEQIEQ